MPIPFLKTGGPIFPKWLWTLICTQLFAVSFVKSQYIPCEDFSRNQPQCCAQDNPQCNGCLQNCVEDPLVHHVSKIVEQPDEEITQEINTKVYLACTFNTEVSCKWSKDGEEVTDIGPWFNHQWKTGNGENTRDCSLVISQLSTAESGSWVCSSMANGYLKEVSSRPSRVYIYLNILEHPDEKLIQVINNEVHLVCKFSTIMNCTWSKDGVEVKDIGTESNRRWLAGSGENTEDCTLVISHLSTADEGSWVCSSIANSHFKEVSSRPSRVYITPMEPLIFYFDEVWNDAYKIYPGEEAMSLINCQFPSSNITKTIKLWWVLENTRVLEGQANKRYMKLGPKLIAVIDEKLQQKKAVDLKCMAEDEFGHVSTAKVVIHVFKIVEHPDEEITRQVNSEVHLVCKFNAKVDCKWSKDGVEMKDIGHMFNRKWATGSGENTDDCSLILRHLRAIDEGSWVCSNSGYGLFKEVSSRPSRVYIYLKILDHPDNEVAQEINTEVYLACTFNNIVSCKWSKDGEEVTDIGPRFKRQWKTGNGENTRDCSLVITHLSTAESGSWVCSSMANGHLKEVSSRPSRVYIYLNILEQPDEKIIQVVSSKVYLFCKFNAKVDCKWSKDGVEVKDIGTESNRQWKAGNGENTDDCSLVIRHLSAADEGRWVCSNMANGHFQEVSSRPSRVYTYLRVLKQPDEEITQEFNSEVHLDCKFNFIVSCKWSKNGVEMKEIGPRFNHKWASGSGENTDDCSLVINHLSADDEGSWVCSSRANGDFKEVLSRPSRLYIALSKPLIYHGDTFLTRSFQYNPREEALVALNCQFPSSDVTRTITLWWLLENTRVYQGEANQRTLKLGPELIAVIDEKLQRQKAIGLICMAEDEFGHVSTAKVVIHVGSYHQTNKFPVDKPLAEEMPFTPVSPFANLLNAILSFLYYLFNYI